MKISDTQVKKILTQKGHGFTQLGFNMLISRLSRQYAQEPSDDALGKFTEEINVFVSRYANIMKQDMALINQL